MTAPPPCQTDLAKRKLRKSPLEKVEFVEELVASFANIMGERVASMVFM
jgi:hypothetical protein